VHVLVTGATGFIGSHLVQALVDSGANVHAFTRGSSSLHRLGRCASSITIHRGDVTDRVTVEECIRAANPEVVFHLAADLSARQADAGPDAADKSLAVNLEGTVNVVRAAAGSGTRVMKLVRTGSIGEYGNADTPFDERTHEQPLSPYASSLVAATNFCREIAPRVGFDLITVRPALVYGPGQDERFFISQLVKACLDGADFEMTEGNQKRDFIYVEDVVAGVLATAVAEGLGGEVLNLATGEGHLLAEVAQLVLELTGSSIQIKLGARQSTQADLPDHVSSPLHAAELLGWRAGVGLEEGLRRTIEVERARRA
jgi:UDP-glucose 4-epimerase